MNCRVMTAKVSTVGSSLEINLGSSISLHVYRCAAALAAGERRGLNDAVDTSEL